MQDTRLLPCPFCGAPANAWEWNGGARADCSRWRDENGVTHFVGIGAKTMKEAAEMWNARAGEDIPMEYLEAGGTL